MDWRRGINRVAWYASAIALLAIAAEMWEEVFEDDRVAVVGPMDWALLAGASIGGAVLVWLGIRGIGWIAAGFLGDGYASGSTGIRPDAPAEQESAPR